MCYTLVGLIGNGVLGLILVVMVIADPYGIPYELSNFEGRIALSFYRVAENVAVFNYYGTLLGIHLKIFFQQTCTSDDALN